MPQQYLYSESETMSTDDDMAEFVHYRKYKYGQSYQCSMNLLEDMGKAEVENKPLLKNCWVIGDEARPISGQQEQVEEIWGLRCFPSYPKVSYNEVVNNVQNTARVPINAQNSRSTSHGEVSQTGGMFGLGGTTPLQSSPSQPQRPVRSSTQAIRTTRAQQLRAQALQTTTTNNIPHNRMQGLQRLSSRRNAQNGTPASRSARGQNNGISISDTSSPVVTRPGQAQGSYNYDISEQKSQFSSAVAVSLPSTVPDSYQNLNSRPQDTSDPDVQIGVEIEFLVAQEKATKGELRERIQEDGRYFVPLEQQHMTTMVSGIPARKHISQLLRAAGIPAVSDYELHEEVRQAAACFKGPLDVDDEYAVWAVKYESGCIVTAVHEGLFDYLGLEFASRKLYSNAHGFKEIRKALRLLRRHVLVATSTACGTHVHVDAATLDLQGRKHFLCLYILVERELFLLTAPHRRSNNRWCSPVWETSRLAEDAEDVLRERGEIGEDDQLPIAQKMAAMKALILDCASTEDLQTCLGRNMLPPFDRAALSLKRVGDQSYTFEFRHFQKALDPEVIENFIQLCVALMMAVYGVGEPGRPSFEEIYEAFDNIKGWKDLLATIGLQNSIGFWTKLLSTYPVVSSCRSKEGRPSSFLPPLD